MIYICAWHAAPLQPDWCTVSRIAAAAAERDMEARRAVEYPFKAILSCTMQNSVVALQSCLSNDGVETEVEFRNGADYRLYKTYDIADLGTWGSHGVEIDLRRNYAIKAQNANTVLVLNLVIINRVNGDVVFQKSAGTFGVIQASR
jgi:hypothetical protein